MAKSIIDSENNNNSIYFITLSVIVLSLLVYYIRRCFTYWLRLGVKQITPSFPLGNFTRAFTFCQNVGENVQDLYHLTDDPISGIYLSFKPALLIRDPEIIQEILVKNFAHFRDRGAYVDEEYDPLSGHLFSLAGDKWRNLRAKLTPTFTSGKLKMMFQTLLNCGITLDNYIEKLANDSKVFEVRDLMARYTTDIIASVAFGIDIDSINNPDILFRRMGRKVFQPGFKNGVRFAFTFLIPKLISTLKIKFVDRDVEEFMQTIVKETVDYRETNNVERKDLMQLLIQLKNTGKVNYDGTFESKTNENALTMNEITAQAFVFFLAGFETSSSTMSFCLFELAKNKEIQERVRKEIHEVMANHDNKITYDSLSEMKYLESCIDETLRIYPAVPVLNRVCTKPIKLPGTDFMIEDNTAILIPVLALQRNAKYYPDPMKFNPDRFYLKEDNIPPFTYLPFGEGPRNCIGLRMGKILTKVGLCIMLSKYKYELGPNTDSEIKLSKTTFVLTPASGVNLKITRI